MDRVVYMKLAGGKYPLLFSMGALIEICEKYNSLQEAIDLMTKDTTFQTLFDIAVILSKAGSDYLKLQKKKAQQLTIDQLVFGNPFEIGGGKLHSAVISCIDAGARQTVEAEENSKNAETALG